MTSALAAVASSGVDLVEVYLTMTVPSRLVVKDSLGDSAVLDALRFNAPNGCSGGMDCSMTSSLTGNERRWRPARKVAGDDFRGSNPRTTFGAYGTWRAAMEAAGRGHLMGHRTSKSTAGKASNVAPRSPQRARRDKAPAPCTRRHGPLSMDLVRRARRSRRVLALVRHTAGGGRGLHDVLRNLPEHAVATTQSL